MNTLRTECRRVNQFWVGNDSGRWPSESDSEAHSNLNGYKSLRSPLLDKLKLNDQVVDRRHDEGERGIRRNFGSRARAKAKSNILDTSRIIFGHLLNPSSEATGTATSLEFRERCVDDARLATLAFPTSKPS